MKVFRNLYGMILFKFDDLKLLEMIDDLIVLNRHYSLHLEFKRLKHIFTLKLFKVSLSSILNDLKAMIIYTEKVKQHSQIGCIL